MSIKKRKLKDGTVVYDAILEYGTVDGVRDRRKRTFATLKEAQAAERDAERLRGALRHHGRLKLGEYVERYYWPIASRRLEATSLDTYRKELDKRILTIKGAYVTASSKHGGNQMKATKTKGSQRVLPMSALFIENAIFDCDGEGPWIANEEGGRMSPSTGRHMYSRYMAGKDLPQVTLENMRHSFATACLHAGMNVEDVSKMLGHSDINTTFRRYVKPDLEDMRVAFRKIPWSHEGE